LFDPTIHLANREVKASSYENPRFVDVTIKASKMDPYRQGVKIYLGRAPGDLSPAAAALNYVIKRDYKPGSFFLFGDGRPLMRDRFARVVKRALTATGLDWRLYFSQSFTIGSKPFRILLSRPGEVGECSILPAHSYTAVGSLQCCRMLVRTSGHVLARNSSVRP